MCTILIARRIGPANILIIHLIFRLFEMSYMMDEVKQFFNKLSDNLKNSTGSIDIIVTSGTSVLFEHADEWIRFGASNLTEIYDALKEIIAMFSHYEADKTSQEPPGNELFATLQDLAYHSAIFGVYFFAIENSFEEKNINSTTSGLDKEKKGTFNMKSAILKSDRGNTDNAESPKLMEMIANEASKAFTAFDIVFSNHSYDYSYKLSCLYDFQRSLLSLQMAFTILKKSWWTAGRGCSEEREPRSL